jgi:hypothetical protein
MNLLLLLLLVAYHRRPLILLLLDLTWTLQPSLASPTVATAIDVCGAMMQLP